MPATKLRRVEREEIEANMGLVFMVAGRCSRYAHDLVDFDDLLSWGTLGLIHALERFDATKGFKLSSYAFRCIQGRILSGMRKTYSEMWGSKERGEDVTPYLVPREDREQGSWDPSIKGELNLSAQLVMDRVWPSLTDKQRRIWALRIHGGLTHTEIAELLGVTRQHIHQVWTYSIEKARKILAEREAA